MKGNFAGTLANLRDKDPAAAARIERRLRASGRLTTPPVLRDTACGHGREHLRVAEDPGEMGPAGPVVDPLRPSPFAVWVCGACEAGPPPETSRVNVITSIFLAGPEDKP